MSFKRSKAKTVNHPPHPPNAPPPLFWQKIDILFIYYRLSTYYIIPLTMLLFRQKGKRNNDDPLYIVHVCTQTGYRRILKFFKQAGNSLIWMLLFFKWYFLWVSQHYVFKYQAQKLCYSFMCTFSVFFGQKCCGHTCMYLRFVQVFLIPGTWIITDVEFTVFKILFQNFLQGSDTNSEFNTWPFPKKVGLLIFCNTCFSPFSICTANGKL